MKKQVDDATIMDKTYTYLALGDSYTIGEQVESRENFPNQLSTLLTQRGLKFNSPEIVAKTGWTTEELQLGIDKGTISRQYDLVTLLIGVNNQYRGRTAAAYAPDFESLLRQAIHFAGDDPGHVIVFSIPDWGVTPFAEGRNRLEIARAIDDFNSVNQKIAASFNVNYINITASTREAGHDKSLLAIDGLHPSGKEYAKWAGWASDLVERIFKN